MQPQEGRGRRAENDSFVDIGYSSPDWEFILPIVLSSHGLDSCQMNPSAHQLGVLPIGMRSQAGGEDSGAWAKRKEIAAFCSNFYYASWLEWEELGLAVVLTAAEL